MNSDSEIVEYVLATVHREAPAHEDWARRILEALVPVITQASLTTEESRFVPFSVAVVTFPAEYQWEGFVLDAPVDCSSANVMKFAGLTSPGDSYLTARLVDGHLAIVGYGKPHVVIGGRMDPTLAFAMLPPPEYAFIAATVLGPYTMLLEGFRTELAFLFKGELLPREDFLLAAKFTFMRDTLTSKDVTFEHKGFPPTPVALVRPAAALRVIEDIVRGAWFAGKGGILAFCPSGFQRGSPAESILSFESLLDQYLDVQVSREEHSSHQTAETLVRMLKVEKILSDHTATAVRASTLDGAVLFDRRFRMRAIRATLRAPRLRDLSIRHATGGPALDLRTRGTRHQSAASWVAAARSRMAVVVSQDRTVRFFGTDPQVGLVHFSPRPSLFD
jgi:hypothetical protein